MERPEPPAAVVPFEPDHAEAVAAMARELAAFHGEEALATASDYVRRASGPGRVSLVWVATLGREPCGFAAANDWMNYVHGFPVRNIDLFFVREPARGLGLGRALLGALVRDATASGCRRVTVAAEPDNAGANAFYLRLGFDLRRPAANRYAASGAALDRLAGM